MTVMRHDSAGEMFGTQGRLARIRREQKIAIGSEAEEEEEDDDEEETCEEEEDDEMCRTRLLGSNCRACRWNSCKLLEINRLYEDEGRNSLDNSKDEEQVRLKNWHDCDRARQASKSLVDFLAFNSHQQQYKIDNDKQCKKSYMNDESEDQFGNSKSNKAVGRQKQNDSYHFESDHKRRQQQQVKGIKERENNFDAFQASQKESCWPSNLSKQQRESICTKSVKDLASNKRRHVAHLIASRAHRRRRNRRSSGIASKIITSASLSSSSPVLWQYEESHQHLQNQTKQLLSRLPDTFIDSTKAEDMQSKAESNSESQRMGAALSTSDNNAFMGQLDALAGRPMAEFNDVHACETKTVKDNGHANDDEDQTNRFHCFVDVASCFETSQAYSNNNNGKAEQQRQVSARLRGCTTNERSSCCYNNADSSYSNDARLSGNCLKRHSHDCYNIDYSDATTPTPSPNQAKGTKLKRNSQVTDNELQLEEFGGQQGVGGSEYGHSLANVDGNKLSTVEDQSKLKLSIVPDICYPKGTPITTTTEPIDSKHLTIIQDKQEKEIFHYQRQKLEERGAKGEKRVERNDYFDSNKYYRQQQRLVDTDIKQRINFAQNKQHYLNDETNENTTNVTIPTHSNKPIVVDLNNFSNNSTSKFMGYNSWQKVSLQPGSSATYKVVKQQQADAVSGSPTTTFSLREGETIPCKRQETCETISIDQRLQRKEQHNNNKTIARYSRPGRSPISLQRQTNARLTRHRLKIQQQRQEQLAHLALRERQQISQQTNSNIHYNATNGKRSNTNSIFGQQNSSPSPRPSPGRDIFGPISRNTGCAQINLDYHFSDRGSNNNSNCNIKSSLPNSPTNAQHTYNLGNNNNPNQTNFCTLLTISDQQYQPIEVDTYPTTIINSRAIEISDNQLACSSGQQQHSSVNSISTQQQVAPSNAGNVIVYNKFNMFRSTSDRHNHFDSGESKRSYNKKSEVDVEDTQTICSKTESTISLNRPFCKICHVGSTKNGDKLISPCKCSGTMQYIHCGCLLKWLEISNRTNEKPMSCELCAHEYTWHKKFNYKEAKLPRCSFKDIVCHLVFLAAIGIMFLSALAPIMYRKSHDQSAAVSTFTSPSKLGTTESSLSSFKSTNNQIDEQRTVRRHHNIPSSSYHYTSHNGQSNHLAATGRLANDEKFMLLCAASFFISFFLAIYVQTKARDTLYGLFIKFLAMNQTYYITEYDHGQLNVNTNNNSTVNGSNNVNTGACGATNSDSSSTSVGGVGSSTNAKLEQQHHHYQPQQQHNSEESLFDRKSSEKS